MAANIKQLFSLYALYARMDLNWFLQDRKVCLIVMASEWAGTISSISGIFLLSTRFGGIGGLSGDEVIWMLAFYAFADGLTYMITGCNNVSHMSRRVGRGQIDHMLIQPVPLPIQMLAEGFMPYTGSSEFIMGIVLLAVSSARLGLIMTPLWIAKFALLTVCRMLIALGLSFFAASAAFYKPVSCEEISSVVLDSLGTLGRYPLFGLPDWLVGVLVSVLPAGLMAWLPTLLLLNKGAQSLTLALPLAVAAACVSLAIYFFRKGLKHYEKTGSNRYRSMGFRS